MLIFTDSSLFFSQSFSFCSESILFFSEPFSCFTFVIPAILPCHSREGGNPVVVKWYNMNQYWVYILASKKNDTLYIGVTNDLLRRVYEHRENRIDGFTKKYNLFLLVYIEEFQNIKDAIYREKCIKKWNRSWKLKLIEEQNPSWKDLYETF